MNNAQSRVEVLRKRLGIERRRSFSATRNDTSLPLRQLSPEHLSPLTVPRRPTLEEPISPLHVNPRPNSPMIDRPLRSNSLDRAAIVAPTLVCSDRGFTP